jgi:hypothetical protein
MGRHSFIKIIKLQMFQPKKQTKQSWEEDDDCLLSKLSKEDSTSGLSTCSSNKSVRFGDCHLSNGIEISPGESKEFDQGEMVKIYAKIEIGLGLWNVGHRRKKVSCRVFGRCLLRVEH